MDKSNTNLFQRQQALLAAAKGYSTPSISESLKKSIIAASTAGNLFNANEKKIISIAELATKTHPTALNFANLINPAGPSVLNEVSKFRSAVANHTIASQAAERLKIFSGLTKPDYLSSVVNKIATGGGARNSLIEDAIKRLSPVLSTSFLTAQHTALDQFKKMAIAMQSQEVFSENISKFLRSNLGDWRDQIVLPESPQLLYPKQGFDRRLTEHSTPVFFEVVADAGLTDSSVDIALFGPVIAAIGDESLSDEERNTRCYTRIFQLENRIRVFIFEAMTKTYGQGWFKQLPADVKENLKEIHDKKTKAGENRTLLECTDFSHYIKIIFKGDLWRDIFQPLFGTRRKEDVLESFNRLKPVRDTAMHSNVVSHEDWVMLYFETDRLLKVITKTANRHQ